MKSLYACGSNLLGHIAPNNNSSNNNDGDDGDDGDDSGLVTIPRCVFSGLVGARVLYVGWGDVLCML